MIVADEAFDELLDRAIEAEEAGGETGERRRIRFALDVDRAVKKALARADHGPPWLTQTLKRFECRLYFFRHRDVLYLVGCVALAGASVAASGVGREVVGGEHT